MGSIRGNIITYVALCTVIIIAVTATLNSAVLREALITIDRVMDSVNSLSDASHKIVTFLDEVVLKVNENLQLITYASENVSAETKDVMESATSLQATVEQFHI